MGARRSSPGCGWSDNPKYPEMAEDFAKTFRVLKSLPCDVFLGPHGVAIRPGGEGASARGGREAEPVHRPGRIPGVPRAIRGHLPAAAGSGAARGLIPAVRGPDERCSRRLPGANGKERKGYRWIRSTSPRAPGRAGPGAGQVRRAGAVLLGCREGVRRGAARAGPGRGPGPARLVLGHRSAAVRDALAGPAGRLRQLPLHRLRHRLQPPGCAPAAGPARAGRGGDLYEEELARLFRRVRRGGRPGRLRPARAGPLSDALRLDRLPANPAPRCSTG